ncbi:MAG: VOC family protein [Candidatus Cybelea sp.]
MKSTRDVICRARDLSAVKAYYAGKLGLPIVVDSERLVGFDTGAVTLYYERGEPGEPVFDFLVDDVAAAKVRLAAAGCEIIEEDPAIPRVYLRDPFGLIFNIDEANSIG